MRLLPLALAALAVTSAPVLAHNPAAPLQPGVAPLPGPDNRPEWRGENALRPHAGVDMPGRDAWLAECRGRLSRRDDGLGGALLGSVAGGFAGNRIAGRRNRLAGTIAGAAVGAVTGAAIDKAEDRRGPARDECETYLESYYDYYARAGQGGYGYAGHGAHGYGQGCCQQPMMMVPIVRAPRREPECTETVEYVTEYVPAPRTRRIPAKRAKIVPDKRVRIK